METQIGAGDYSKLKRSFGDYNLFCVNAIGRSEVSSSSGEEILGLSLWDIPGTVQIAVFRMMME